MGDDVLGINEAEDVIVLNGGGRRVLFGPLAFVQDEVALHTAPVSLDERLGYRS